MKAKIIRIGNSKGVRIPKALLEETRLGPEVELSLRGNEIIITQAKVRSLFVQVR